MAPDTSLYSGYSLVEDSLLERLMHVASLWIDAARASLSIDPLSDARAAARLDELLAYAERRGFLVYPETLLGVFNGRRVAVVTSGSCVEKQLTELNQDVLVASDGATSVILDVLGYCPDVIVSDLDGVVEDILFCSRLGSIVVVHAHGDNTWILEDIVPSLEKVAGTVQARIHSPRVLFAPGFTDGDRAVLLSLLGGASEIELLGWCPGERQHPLSKRLPNPAKPRKLAIGEVYLRLAEALGRVQKRS